MQVAQLDIGAVDTLAIARFQLLSLGYDANEDIRRTSLVAQLQAKFHAGATDPLAQKRAGLVLDVFRFDQARYAVVGQRTGRKIQLGDELEVTIRAVDMDRRTVDFMLAGEAPPVTTSGKFERRKNERRSASKSTKPTHAKKSGKGGKGKRSKRG